MRQLMLEKVSYFRYEGFSCQAFPEDIEKGTDRGFTLLGRLQSHMRDLLVKHLTCIPQSNSNNCYMLPNSLFCLCGFFRFVVAYFLPL